MKKYYFAVVILACIILGAVAYGFYVTGGPRTVRNKKFDAKRIDDFTNLSNSIDNYYSRNYSLPGRLEDLSKSGVSHPQDLPLLDPESQEAYEYHVTGPTNYQLCATFATISETGSSEYRHFTYSESREYQHGKGRHCFDKEVRNSYKPYSSAPWLSPIPSPTPRTYVTSCGRYRTLNACDNAALQGEQCAWYICQNVCLTNGTDVNTVCTYGAKVVVPDGT